MESVHSVNGCLTVDTCSYSCEYVYCHSVDDSSGILVIYIRIVIMKYSFALSPWKPIKKKRYTYVQTVGEFVSMGKCCDSNIN